MKSLITTSICVLTLCAMLLPVTASAHWMVDGTAVSTASGIQWDPQLSTDGAGGSIIAWHDNRSGSWSIYAQLVDADGFVQWLTDGIAVNDDPGPQVYPDITTDMAGGAIITWYNDESPDQDVHAQRLDAAGNLLWGASGIVVCSDSLNQKDPEIVPDGAGGAIITWLDGRNTLNTKADIYAQRVDACGNILWVADGVAICTAEGNQRELQIIPDGAGGAIIAWHDERYGSWDIFAQRVDACGNVSWTADGVPVCTASGSQVMPDLCTDCGEGAIITWRDFRGAARDIYAQRVRGSGSVAWAANGIVITTTVGASPNPMIASDNAGGGIITWYADIGSGLDIFTQQVDSTGTLAWGSGLPVCTAEHSQHSPRVVPDDYGGAIIIWLDGRNTGDAEDDIYVQRIDRFGLFRWTANGAVVCKATSYQQAHKVIRDGAGGAICTWHDMRSGGWDVYAQRILENLPPVATLLQNYDTRLDGKDITVTWTLSAIGPDAGFSISRSVGPNGTFHEIVQPGIDDCGLSYSFTDRECSPGLEYRYRVDVTDEDGTRILFETPPISIPHRPLTLHQNNPNPFNPSTTIRYYLPERCRVTLDVYNVTGRKIARLVDREQQCGTHEAAWNGIDMNGNSVSSGIYLYRLKAGKDTRTKKMILLR